MDTIRAGAYNVTEILAKQRRLNELTKEIVQSFFPEFSSLDEISVFLMDLQKTNPEQYQSMINKINAALDRRMTNRYNDPYSSIVTKTSVSYADNPVGQGIIE